MRFYDVKMMVEKHSFPDVETKGFGKIRDNFQI